MQTACAAPLPDLGSKKKHCCMHVVQSIIVTAAMAWLARVRTLRVKVKGDSVPYLCQLSNTLEA